MRFLTFRAITGLSVQIGPSAAMTSALPIGFILSEPSLGFACSSSEALNALADHARNERTVGKVDLRGVQ